MAENISVGTKLECSSWNFGMSQDLEQNEIYFVLFLYFFLTRPRYINHFKHNKIKLTTLLETMFIPIIFLKVFR